MDSPHYLARFSLCHSSSKINDGVGGSHCYLTACTGSVIPTLGSSGRVSRYLSSLDLKSSTLIRERLRISLGSELKTFDPWIVKLPSLIVCNFPLPRIAGIATSLPLLSLYVSRRPQLGTQPSRIFHT